MKVSEMTEGTSLDGSEYLFTLDGGQNTKTALSLVGSWIANTALFSALNTSVKTLVGAINLKANSADLSTVATSGNYSDLSGRPNLATVATSGSYSDLTNKPITSTQYFDGTTTSINSLTGDGVSYRGYIANGGTDNSYLGWYGNCILESIGYGATGPHIQRITRVSNGDVYMRYSANNTYSYDTDLIAVGSTPKSVVGTFSSTNNSGGNVKVTHAIKSAHNVQMRIEITPSSNVESGGSVTATLKGQYLPILATSGASYYGARGFVGHLLPDGSFTMRNTSTLAMKKDIGYQVILNYICKDD